MSYSQFIIDMLGDVSNLARKNFGKVKGTTKKSDNNQVLTQTDLEISQEITRRIKDAYPEHNLINEEEGAIDKGSRYTWIIDPIDGTSNFALGVPTYGIMMGLLDEGLPIAGGITLPSFNELYWAEKGKGAFCNNLKIHVTSDSDLLSELIAYGIDGYQNEPDKTKKECQMLADIILNVRNLRSSNSCFDVAMVAKGNYGAWLNQTQKIWDNVPEQIIIEEAGGKYTDFFGAKLDYTKPLQKIDSTFTVCAAAPVLHEKLQDIIRKSS